INTNSKNLINPKQLYSLKNNEDLKFIQKIDLESNNNTESLKNITTTNIIKVYFDKKIFEKEYKKC
ncbi:MAG: hypothetical protein U9R39_01810, partial [Campylobacterota bacterium]|nr:hypothetical protein [Campylobacterota bacterium]